MTSVNVSGYPAKVMIEPGRMKLLAKAIGSADWTRVPLTMAFCLVSDDDRFADALVAMARDWGIDLARTMHAKQSFVYHKQIEIGAAMVATLELGDRFSKNDGRLSFTELLGNVTDLMGNILVEQKITLVTVARPAIGAGRP